MKLRKSKDLTVKLVLLRGLCGCFGPSNNKDLNLRLFDLIAVLIEQVGRYPNENC